MTNTKTNEEIIMEEYSTISVYLNMLSNRTVQITCTRKILGGGGIAQSYASEQLTKKVLLDFQPFGLKEEVIDARLKTLREVNLPEIKPKQLVVVGEFPIPNDVLGANGFPV